MKISIMNFSDRRKEIFNDLFEFCLQNFCFHVVTMVNLFLLPLFSAVAFSLTLPLKFSRLRHTKSVCAQHLGISLVFEQIFLFDFLLNFFGSSG